jgi:acyl-homoserine lactone acylase PvdQ
MNTNPELTEKLNLTKFSVKVACLIGLFAPSLLCEEVTIYRDGWGVPHIYADTDRAVAFGFGYAQAEDRLLALIRNYAEASGQLARIDGDASVSSDFQQRLWGHHSMALRELEQIPQDVSHWLTAFAAGVRHYIEQNEDRVPKGTETVQPVHILALARHLYWRGILQQLDAEHVRSQRDAPHRRTPSSRGTLWGLRRNAPWKMRSRL